MQDLVDLAQKSSLLTAKAAQMAIQFQTEITRKIKKDGSVVTEADQEIQDYLQIELDKVIPGAGFWGEESGFAPATENGLWVLDPIDGTTNYSFGQPIWGITLGYIQDNKIQFGIIELPSLGETLIGINGFGATLNGKKLNNIPAGEIVPHHLISHGESTAKMQFTSPGKMRHIGAFCVEAAFVATQRLRALTTGSINIYDCAGGIVICRELGAEIRHLNGELVDESKWLQGAKGEPFYIGPKNSNFQFEKKAVQ